MSAHCQGGGQDVYRDSPQQITPGSSCSLGGPPGLPPCQGDASSASEADVSWTLWLSDTGLCWPLWITGTVRQGDSAQAFRDIPLASSPLRDRGGT